VTCPTTPQEGVVGVGGWTTWGHSLETSPSNGADDGDGSGPHGPHVSNAPPLARDSARGSSAISGPVAGVVLICNQTQVSGFRGILTSVAVPG
jgi:hypothetical protein